MNPGGSGDRHHDKLLWLANRIFPSLSRDVTGLRFYELTCGCIFYQRVFRDADMDFHVWTYRDAEDGPCETCTRLRENRRLGTLCETVVYKSFLRTG